MRKPRPNTYNPAQALHLIASDRNGLSTELSVLLRPNRARSGSVSAPSEVPRHAEVHPLRPVRPLYRRGRLIHSSRSAGFLRSPFSLDVWRRTFERNSQPR